VALRTRLGLLVIALSRVAGQTQIALAEHGRVVNALGDVATGGPTTGQVQMYLRGMHGRCRLLMAGEAVSFWPVVVRVTARAICLGQQGRSSRVTGCTTNVAVDDVIEQQRPLADLGRRKPEIHERSHRLRSYLPHGMALPAL